MVLLLQAVLHIFLKVCVVGVLGDLYAVVVSREISWTTSTADFFVEVYDWDLIIAEDDTKSLLSFELDLCTRFFPCYAHILGTEDADVHTLGEGSMVCLASSGCSGVVLESFTFSCEHAVSSNALLIVSSQILSIINITFLGCSKQTEGEVTYVYPKNQVAENESTISHFGISNTSFFLKTPQAVQDFSANCFLWHDYAVNMSAYKVSATSHVSKLSATVLQSSSISLVSNATSQAATFTIPYHNATFISQALHYPTSEVGIAVFNSAGSLKVDSSQATFTLLTSQANVALLTTDQGNFSELKNASGSSVSMTSSAKNASGSSVSMTSSAKNASGSSVSMTSSAKNASGSSVCRTSSAKNASGSSVSMTSSAKNASGSSVSMTNSVSMTSSAVTREKNSTHQQPSYSSTKDSVLITFGNWGGKASFSILETKSNSGDSNYSTQSATISHTFNEATSANMISSADLVVNLADSHYSTQSATISHTFNKVTSSNMNSSADIFQSVTVTDILSKSMQSSSSISSTSTGRVDIATVGSESTSNFHKAFGALTKLTSTVVQNQAENSFGKPFNQLAEVTDDEISSQILPTTIVTSNLENANENGNRDIFEIKTANGQEYININVLNDTSKILVSGSGNFQPETSSSPILPNAVNGILETEYQSTTSAIRNSSQELGQSSESQQWKDVMHLVIFVIVGALCVLIFLILGKRYFVTSNPRLN